MDDKEILKYDIKGLKEASTYLANALNLIKDIDAVSEEEYIQLDCMQQDFIDKINEKELELERSES